MLVVTIEIWPGGDARRAVQIGEIQAWNASALAAISDYEVILTDRGNPEFGVAPASRQMAVRGHARRAGVWALVERILRQNRGAEPDGPRESERSVA